MSDLLKIKKIDTSKHKIKQRKLMENMVIPHHPSVSIMSGSQGGGKSTLVANLLTNPLMYGLSHEGMEKELKKNKNAEKRGYFDAIFLMLGSDDDMYEKLIDDGIVKQNHVCHLPTPADIQKVITGQKQIIERVKKDFSKVPKILFIFDDCVNDGALMRSKPFLELFVKGRHLNSSIFFLSQYLNLVTKSCRCKSNYLFQFKSNRAEVDILCDQFCPPTCTKREFASMIHEATKDDKESKNNFLLIVKRCPEDQRFRKNLNKFITLKRMHYAPKLKFQPSKKETEDLDYEQEGTIQSIHQQYLLNDKINQEPEYLDPILDKLVSEQTQQHKPKPRIKNLVSRSTKNYRRSKTHK
jgi:hypothetical protein